MIEIDGAQGEGGGQVLRSSLSLAAITGQTLRVRNIRANRRKPGLMRQHLTAVNAVAAVCNGTLQGASLRSVSIEFTPGTIQPGIYEFSVGTAGSANLVLQTVLPVLLQANAPSRLTISGGTHNPSAPPYEFIEQSYLPALARLGHRVSARIEKYGFYPAGGGEIVVDVEPADYTQPLDLCERGDEKARSLEAVVANLPAGIAARELLTAGEALSIDEAHRHICTRRSPGPGNVLIARLEFEQLVAVFAQFGERDVPAEAVAKRLAKTVRTFAAQPVAVTHHLADQLLLPMALARGGRFTTLRPSRHALTNADVIRRFTGRDIQFKARGTKSGFVCEVP